MTTETTNKLTPVLEENRYYWGTEILKVFKLGRPTLTKIKKADPDAVIPCRAGDMVRGGAVLDWLRQNWGKRA